MRKDNSNSNPLCKCDFCGTIEKWGKTSKPCNAKGNGMHSWRRIPDAGAKS